MDVDVAKTSTQPTISPRKEVKEVVKTPEKITPSGSTKRKSSASPPPRSAGKRPKKDMVKTPELASKSKSVPKTPMVNTPAKGATPKITTPKDAILESPKKNVPGLAPNPDVVRANRFLIMLKNKDVCSETKILHLIQCYNEKNGLIIVLMFPWKMMDVIGKK